MALKKSCSENMQRTPMLKFDFNKAAATLLKSHFRMGFLLKFTAYFQNTFSQEHFRGTSPNV